MNARELMGIVRAAARGREVGARAILALADACSPAIDAHGRASAGLAHALLEVDRTLRPSMRPAAARRFQSWVAEIGARLYGPIELPDNDVPSWLADAHPLAGFRSTPRLPRTADIVVVGAGLAGASTAYHLSPLARRGLRVVVVDAGDPATMASGRNGGNFEIMPENFFGEYEGLLREREKWLARTRPSLRGPPLARAADAQARAILAFCSRNTERLLGIIRREAVACDLSPGGWLRIADTPLEERALGAEVELAREMGIDLELWAKATISRTFHIPAPFAGRFARKSGNYHPFKLVNALLERCIRRGISLYTRSPVIALREGRGARPLVVTADGVIAAKSVVVATNAFTSALLPELAFIEYYQSQILTLEHVRDRLRGATITEKKGDLYYNFPSARKYVDRGRTPRGMLLVGGGLDRPGRDPFKLRRSRAVFELVRAQTDERFPETRAQPPSRLWTGPMAFTPDRAPALGALRMPRRPDGIVVAAGFNGYGGSYCIEAGHVAARLALGDPAPAWAPEHLFSPNRVFR